MKRRRNAQSPQRQKGGVKYVRTMLVMKTPYTQQSKACVWCCYHGGHATTLSCHMNVCVHGHSRPYFDVTCVTFHRVSLRQSALRAPQPMGSRSPISNGPKQPVTKAQAQTAYFSPFCIRAQGSLERNLLATLAPTHLTGDSALLAGEEKGEIASHQPGDLSNRA